MPRAPRPLPAFAALLAALLALGAAPSRKPTIDAEAPSATSEVAVVFDDFDFNSFFFEKIHFRKIGI